MNAAYLTCLVLLFNYKIDFICCHVSGTDHEDEDHHHQITVSPSPPISDHRFFLQEIFIKYGHKGQMTFEGFEHLMESLGLGNIIISDHDVKAHKENPDVNIHDTHDHTKKIDHVDVTTPKGRDHNHSTTETLTTRASNRPSTTHYRHNHHSISPSPSRPSFVDSTTPMASLHLTTQESNDLNVEDGQNNSPSQPSINFHYELKEAKIPELIVNISSLVNQHQEFEDRTPQIVIEQCLSPREILEAFGINQTSSLNPVSFLHLCPAIIYELDQGHCLFKDHSHIATKNVSVFDCWLFSSLAVLVISLCGLLSVAVIPIMQKWFYHTLIQFLIGLAVGTLSGDALLHLMPHAMLGEEDDHDHKNVLSPIEAEKVAIWRGFSALCGIFFFFIAERLLASYSLYRNKKKGIPLSMKTGDTNHASQDIYNGNVGEKLSQYRKRSYEIEQNEKEMIKMFEVGNSRKLSSKSLHSLEANFQNSPNYNVDAPGTVVYSPASDYDIKSTKISHGHGHGHSHEVPDSISSVAWMVIMGDGLHNFCDGLAIGAAFTSGIEGGISTAVAVFCHELPHELGDFAMLLKTGMKVKEALFYNGLSSVLCFVGMVIGVSLGNVHSATSWIFAATAGMFIYIALVDMLPELSNSNDKSTSTTFQLLVQILGISTGTCIMLLIANYEQDLKSIIS